LTLVRQIVFRGRTRRFAGMASPDAIIDGFTACFPLLGDYARRLHQTPASLDRERETTRQIELWFQMLSESGPDRSPGAADGDGGADPVQAMVQREAEEQIGVREELLGQLLGERLVTRCIEVQEGRLAVTQVQQIVDCLLPDVPVEITGDPPSASLPPVRDVDDAPGTERSDGPRLYVVDRDAFGLELAREWVRTGLPRNPVR
jgi:hypothetical protein